MLFKQGLVVIVFSFCLFDIALAAPTLLPLSGVTKIDAGNDHTCAVLSTGGVQCWGNNGGKLGNDHSEAKSEAVAVVELKSDVTDIALGWSHTCALLATNEIQCWGYNGSGQFGNDSTTSSNKPADVVVGLSSGVTTIAAGQYHTCALLTTGGAQCWGNNGYGRLGNGTTVSSRTPVDVTGLSNVTAIALGENHTCALLGTSTNGVQCWGSNGYGKIGKKGGSQSTEPVPVTGDSDVGLVGMIAIATGTSHTCAVLNTGEVQCWGYNYRGQCGHQYKSTEDTRIPVTVAGLSGVIAIAAGESHTCALLDTGEVQCWGDNYVGQLGNGDSAEVRKNGQTRVYFTPVTVTGLSGVTAITAGGSHTCALLDTGEVRCWGINSSGRLGSGSSEPESSTPVPVMINGYTLTLKTAGTGSGTVSGDGNFPAGTEISNLKAVPDAGSTFEGWSPEFCGGTFKMPDNNFQCTATFGGAALVKQMVTVNQSGTGTGTVSGGGEFAVGSTVNLTAIPDAGSTFIGWTPAPCAANFVMPDQALTCTANFVVSTVDDNCDAQHATFDPATGIVTLPAIDIPLLDPVTGIATGNFSVFSGQLQLTTGIGDFQFVSSNFNYVNQINQLNPCHAKYTYADDILNQGGLLHLPFLEVPSMVVVPPDTQVPGPTQIFEVTLRQWFHVESYKFLQVK